MVIENPLEQKIKKIKAFQRVIDEKQDLDEKIERLKSFFITDIYNSLEKEEQELLKQQIEHMVLYSCILEQRIMKL